MRAKGPTSGTTNGASPNGTPQSDTPPAKAKRPGSDNHGSPYADARDLVDTASTSGRLSTWANAVRSAGLTDVLSGRGPLTVFAPTNVAFEKLPSHELEALLADHSRLADVLRQHVVKGRVRAPRPDTPGSHTSIGGGVLTLSALPGSYRVNDANVVRTNIRASNGVIHVIDTVLMPR
jgi:uncharacterized surface protein with fasciclin (FAS1) repeats